MCIVRLIWFLPKFFIELIGSVFHNQYRCRPPKVKLMTCSGADFLHWSSVGQSVSNPQIKNSLNQPTNQRFYKHPILQLTFNRHWGKTIILHWEHNHNFNSWIFKFVAQNKSWHLTITTICYKPRSNHPIKTQKLSSKQYSTIVMHTHNRPWSCLILNI